MEPLLRVVIDTVARHYAIDPSTILSADRHNSTVVVRSTAMYVARLVGSFSYPQIATAFGRDHSTVIHACKKVALRASKSPLYRQELDGLIKDIQGGGLTGRSVIVRHEVLAAIERQMEHGLYGSSIEDAVDRILCTHIQRETGKR